MSTTLNPNEMAGLRLGDILVKQGAISRFHMEEHSVHARGRIGEYLRAHNIISGKNLAQSLASQQQIDYVDFTTNPPDRTLFSPREWPHYMAHHYVPYAKQGNTLIVASTEPNAKLKALLEKHYQCPVTMVATAPRDISLYFSTAGATSSRRAATLSLRRKYKHLTADRTLVPEQFVPIIIALLIPLTLIIGAPHYGWQIVLLACNLFYFASLYVKYQFLVHGSKRFNQLRRQERKTITALEQMNPDTLPVYSILVPFYKEPREVMQRLITSLNALDYPREKLDIKLVCEADDTETIAALKALQPPQTMHIVTVPAGHPRTKPKACNVALQHARGEFLVIYDAEDKPAPDQLKRAVLAFHEAGPEVACLQASLNYYNRNENLLTQLFSIEYSALFNLLLPALEQLHIPIPLGGTSNHLRLSALRDIGGWDAFNVTEDADLGIRLAYFGYKTQVLLSRTMEEAPITLNAWRKQRTRWIKGYIQTWLVYMRDRSTLKLRLGTQAYYGFQFFVGAPAITFLLAPVFWVIFTASLLGIIPGNVHPLTQLLCLMVLCGGILNNLFYARAVLRIEKWYDLRKAMMVYPFYWLLHSVAAACALIELVHKPHYWAKTEHGVCKIT